MAYSEKFLRLSPRRGALLGRGFHRRLDPLATERNGSHPLVRWSALFLVTATGCMAQVGSNLTVPADAGQTCKDHCSSIGMTLSAVAIMANNVGCICEPVGKENAAVAREASSVAGGMTVVLMEEAARQQQQASQNTAYR